MDGFSNRIQRILSVPDQLQFLYDELGKNRFHEQTNPNGIINLGTAQNRLLGDVMIEKMKRLDLSQCDESMLMYQDARGCPEFRTAMADFLTDFLQAPQKLDTDRIRVLNGLTPLIDITAYVFCDEGDTILVPAPMYGGIVRNTGHRPNVKVQPVNLSSKPGVNGEEAFELTVEQLERSYCEAVRNGGQVRALFLTNPQNPQGTVYTKDQLLAYLKFCKKYELHVIFDEIYLASVYDDAVPMCSILGFSNDELPDPQMVHFLWSFGKDFSYPGSHCGMLYTQNKAMLRGVDALAEYHQVSSLTQIALTQILEDKEWLHTVYFPTCHSRLREARDIVMTTLDELGLEYVKPSAGFYIWTNFNKFLSSSTTEEETAFCRHMLFHGLMILPSSGFHGNEPGWFRVLFSSPLPELRKALERLREGALSYIAVTKPSKMSSSQPGAAANSNEGSSLESLLRSLKVNLTNSDWLEQNSAEQWKTDNPDSYTELIEEIQRTTEN